MEHAMRKHVKINAQDDPVYYKTMSEKIDSIMQNHRGEWDAILENLKEAREEMEAGRKECSIKG